MEGSFLPPLLMATALMLMLLGAWQAAQAVWTDSKARAAGHFLAGTAPDTRPIIPCVFYCIGLILIAQHFDPVAELVPLSTLLLADSAAFAAWFVLLRRRVERHYASDTLSG